MAERAAARGDDRLGGEHAADVLRARRRAQQDHALTAGGDGCSPVGVEDGQAVGVAWRCADALRQHARRLQRRGLEGGSQQTFQLLDRDLLKCDRLGHDAVVDELGGDPDGGMRGPLGRPDLQKIQAFAFDGELDIDRVFVDALETIPMIHQLAEMDCAQRAGIADRRGCR